MSLGVITDMLPIEVDAYQVQYCNRRVTMLAWLGVERSHIRMNEEVF